MTRANDDYNAPCDLGERGYWFKMTKNVWVRQGDITEFEGDAIVNAANTELKAGTGVCGAIFKAAGFDELTKACSEIGGCNFGDAVVTPGFNLPAHYIIHAAGPVYGQHNGSEPDLLRSCYQQSLQVAHTNCFESIAFPLISTGAYGYPKEDAISIAIAAIREFYRDNPFTCIARVVIYGYTSEDAELTQAALDT